MNLYQINKEIELAINESIDFETGEIKDPQRLENLHIALDKKREGVALYIKNTVPEIKAIDEEIKALAARKKSKINLVEWLKNSLINDMMKNNIDKFETAKVSISFRRSEVLEVKTTDGIPEEYLIKTPPKVDKAGLKKLVKSGAVFNGVELITRQNIQIK